MMPSSTVLIRQIGRICPIGRIGPIDRIGLIGLMCHRPKTLPGTIAAPTPIAGQLERSIYREARGQCHTNGADAAQKEARHSHPWA